MQPKQMGDDEIQSAIKTAIREAVDFCESEVSKDRIKAQRYVSGEVDISADEGRSQVISTKCRDMVRTAMPALLRTFTQSSPVEYIPRRPEHVAGARQARVYAQMVFDRNKGFSLLHGAFFDALVKKCGVIKAFWDEAEKVEFDEYRNIAPQSAQYAVSQPGASLIEHTQNEDGTYNLKVAITRKSGELKLQAIPPEDFFIDQSATSVRDAFICGDSTEMRVGDLVEMGFNFEEVYALAGAEDGTTGDAEQFERDGWDDNQRGDTINDPSMRPILVTECYTRLDIEGTGIPKLYQFICAGTKYEVLEYTPCDMVPYAVFECDPQPHTFFGQSMVDYLINDQDASTSLLRGLLDNIYMTNTPGVAFDVNSIKTQDIKNKEIGALVRTNGPPANAIMPLAIPFVAHQTLPALQYFDQQIDLKTGVSRANAGMDIDALQNTTAAGVHAAVEAHSAAIELMARHLAEGGMTDLFKIILKLVRANAPADEMMQINDEFVPVSPMNWSADLDVATKVGLGTNQRDEKIAMLNWIIQDHNAIFEKYGLQNPVVTITQARQTRADLIEMAGLHDVSRYYQPMDEQREAAIFQHQQAAAAQQQQSDPNAAFIQVEGMKVQERAQSNAAETQRKAAKDAAEIDLRRDSMAQDRVIKAADLFAKHQAQVDQQAIVAEQSAPRPYPG